MSTYEISKSSLLSLKAEILRKQDGLTKVKVENEEKFKTIKKKALELKNKGVEEREAKDLDVEDQDLLRLSRAKLEAKAKLYNKLSNQPIGDEELSQHYLVSFGKKTKDWPHAFDDGPPDLPVESDDEIISDHYDDNVEPENEWVEYTDSLGRTRTCLKKDLQYLKSKDEELREHAEKRNQTAKTDIESVEAAAGTKPPLSEADEEIQMLSGDMRREMLRRQWEKEEEELRDKSDIHYQNVLFDEARQHGVGYYAFSKDEEERAKQQEALQKLREETLQKQKKAQNLKSARERQMAARMKAARNRRRARLGLPPEDDVDPPSIELPNEPEINKKVDKEIERLEKRLDEARKRHVRPWDVGKDGVREFYEMTQEEWNEKQRKERRSDFAPPTSYSRKFSETKIGPYDSYELDKSLRFSSKKEYVNPYKNSESQCKEYMRAEDDEDNDRLMEDYRQSKDQRNAKGAQIPPPATLDNFCPSSGNKRKSNSSESTNISDSIEAGLKFLRTQVETKKRRYEVL